MNRQRSGRYGRTLRSNRLMTSRADSPPTALLMIGKQMSGWACDSSRWKMVYHLSCGSSTPIRPSMIDDPYRQITTFLIPHAIFHLLVNRERDNRFAARPRAVKRICPRSLLGSVIVCFPCPTNSVSLHSIAFYRSCGKCRTVATGGQAVFAAPLGTGRSHGFFAVRPHARPHARMTRLAGTARPTALPRRAKAKVGRGVPAEPLGTDKETVIAPGIECG